MLWRTYPPGHCPPVCSDLGSLSLNLNIQTLIPKIDKYLTICHLWWGRFRRIYTQNHLYERTSILVIWPDLAIKNLRFFLYSDNLVYTLFFTKVLVTTISHPQKYGFLFVLIKTNLQLSKYHWVLLFIKYLLRTACTSHRHLCKQSDRYVRSCLCLWCAKTKANQLKTID